MLNNRLKLLITLFLFLTVVCSIVFLKNNKNQTPIETFAQSLATPSPVFTPGPTKNVSVVSPDGKATLTMVQKKSENGNDWTFGVDGKTVFSQNLPNDLSFVIPYNTFSPDNKYIFLIEKSGSGETYPVIKLDSNNPSESEIAEIGSLFYQKYTDYKITDVTGWGGLGLIVVNTDKVNGGVGPSFWYDVYTKSFIELSTRFN